LLGAVSAGLGHLRCQPLLFDPAPSSCPSSHQVPYRRRHHRRGRVPFRDWPHASGSELQPRSRNGQNDCV